MSKLLDAVEVHSLRVDERASQLSEVLKMNTYYHFKFQHQHLNLFESIDSYVLVVLYLLVASQTQVSTLLRAR